MGSSLAATYTSSGAAGELLSSAEVVSGTGALDGISGTLSLSNGISLGDLFEIVISDPANFSASTLLTTLGTNNFDTQLFLFDASGIGIAANDDSADSAQSLLSSSSAAFASLTAGTYYLLIEGSGRYPVDADGNFIFANLLTGADATGTYSASSGVEAFSGLTGNSSEGGNYTIVLTGAEFVSVAVPEPAPTALFLVAVIGLLGLRRRGARCRRISRSHRLSLLAALTVIIASPAARAAPPVSSPVQNRRAERTQQLPPGMGRGLRLLVATYDDLAKDAPDENKRADLAVRDFSRVQRDSRRRVLVDIYLDGSQTLVQLRRQVEKMGGATVAQVDWYRNGLLTAWIPVNQAVKLASIYGVSTVNLALLPRVRAGKTTSQGATVHRTTTVNASSYLGNGVTVGILSDSYDADTTERSYPGFTRASADVTSGDLPGPTNPSGYTTPVSVLAEGSNNTSGATDEGRAMLQIVHDLAPAAKLAFATCGVSESAMATNIALLQSSAGCKVICDDIIFYSEPMFSDGVVAQAVDRVTAKGVTYFSSAGNDGNSGYADDFRPVSSSIGLTRAAAAGISTNSISSTERNAIYQWHSFGTDSSGNPIVVQSITTGDDTATLDFQWDDPFDVAGGITADFDILVFNSSGTYQGMLSSTDSNNSTREPLEIPATDLAANTTYKICIVLTNRISSSARQASQLRYVALTSANISGDYIAVSSPSTFGHCCAATAMGVAAYAYDVVPTTASRTFKPTIEDYSSNGPVRIYFDSAGNRLATGILRKQPAIAAVDGVNTTFFPPSSSGVSANDFEGDGYPNFSGTSAAAPHAAGVAALLMNAASVNGFSAITPADIRAILINSAGKTTDQDLNFCTATAGPVTITANGDTSNDSASSNNFFQVSLNGASGQQLTQITIDLSPVGLHFDTDASVGHAFAIGATTGSPAPAFTSTPTVGVGASGTNNASKATISFSNFRSGDTVGFGVDRDEDLTSNSGNGADEIGGLSAAGGGTITVTVDGATYTGTFVNKLGGAYHYKAGYGLIDAMTALNYLLAR